jgi:DNA-binding MarR family transcriptional regulator/GNAT superfamily N-acetyltransferase
MSDPAVAQVRSFNRVVSERIGALTDRYMGRDRALGEARVLWEISPDGRAVAQLRARLGLDSGYLSRLLGSLQADGLVEIVQDPRDRRARLARLTGRGVREHATLDTSSDDLARGLLEPLGDSQRERLIIAMAEVERLLSAAAVQITAIDPDHDDAVFCLKQYARELNQRSTRTFDPTVGATVTPDETRPPAGRFFVAYLHGEPLGCGAVKHPAGAPAQIKRMWIAPEARGLGLGRRLLTTLEDCARDAGADTARIETNSDLTEALALYTTTGWEQVDAFNDEPYADRWLQKALAPSSAKDAGRSRCHCPSGDHAAGLAPGRERSL